MSFASPSRARCRITSLWEKFFYIEHPDPDLPAPARVVWGDGNNDGAIGPAAPVAPAWRPHSGGRHVLAYANPHGRVEVVDVDGGGIVARAPSSGAPPIGLEWNRRGSELLVVHRDRVQILDATARPIRTIRFARPGPGPSVDSAAFVPGSNAVAILVHSGAAGDVTSRVALFVSRRGAVRKRTIFTSSGRLRGLAVAPNGRRLQVAWPRADQWLFIPTSGAKRIDAVGNIRRQFGAGPEQAFPRVVGWCCQAGD